MRIIDLLYLIFQSLTRRRSRFLFTVLGIAIGIAAILFLVALGYGLQRLLLERITTTESLLTLDIVPPETELIVINQDTLARLKEIPGVEKVSPQAIVSSQVILQDLVSEATANIVDENFFVLSGILPQEGRFFESQEKDKVVINKSLANLFGLDPKQALGKELSIILFGPQLGLSETGETELQEPRQIQKEISLKFKIVGVIGQEDEAPQIFVPLLGAQEANLTLFQAAKIKVKNNEFLEEVRNTLIEMGFSVSALSDTIEQANKIFRAVQIVLGIFGVIGLIVAAIGLINTMTISLLERTNEIGIMRAIGADSQDILKLFLGESTLIGIIGGLFGIGIGIGFAEFFNWAVNLLAKSLGGNPVDLFFYPGWFLVFILILSAFVGLIAGIFPARRASKLNPLTALRYK